MNTCNILKLWRIKYDSMTGLVCSLPLNYWSNFVGISFIIQFFCANLNFFKCNNYLLWKKFLIAVKKHDRIIVGHTFRMLNIFCTSPILLCFECKRRWFVTNIITIVPVIKMKQEKKLLNCNCRNVTYKNKEEIVGFQPMVIHFLVCLMANKILHHVKNINMHTNF